MKKIIIINVDENVINQHAFDDNESTNESIIREFGWLEESGITLESIMDYKEED